MIQKTTSTQHENGSSRIIAPTIAWYTVLWVRSGDEALSFPAINVGLASQSQMAATT